MLSRFSRECVDESTSMGGANESEPSKIAGAFTSQNCVRGPQTLDVLVLVCVSLGHHQQKGSPGFE